MFADKNFGYKKINFFLSIFFDKKPRAVYIQLNDKLFPQLATTHVTTSKLEKSQQKLS
jgi:hypothetical protein